MGCFAIALLVILRAAFQMQFKVARYGFGVTATAVCVIGLFSMSKWGFNLEPREERVRNFYGAVSVEKIWDEEQGSDFLQLHHGGIVHGTQWLSDDWRQTPLSYYSHASGIGRALDTLEKRPNARVGIVGMGSATSAAYAKKGHTFRFYDINPDIVRIAKTHFTYLKDLEARGAKLEIAMGDARLNLEREESQQFDVLLLDAFAGDSVPVHLLTKEAFEIYRRHMKPDGIIAVHVTNRYLTLAPVIKKVAAATGYRWTRIITDAESPYEYTDYLLVTNNEAFLKANEEDTKGYDENEKKLDPPLWTDLRHDLWGVLEKD
jgi:protein-L-isoaspartate O-methyltransferase